MKKNMMEKDHFLLNQNFFDDDKLYSPYSSTFTYKIVDGKTYLI